MGKLMRASLAACLLALTLGGWLIQKPAPSYTGPADIIPNPTMCWGVRAISAAYAAAHGNAFDLRRASDSATMTATYLSNGDLDTATISAWAGGSDVHITKAYDMSGNGWHATQTTASSQPKLILSGGPGNKPYIYSVDVQELRYVGSTFTPATGVMSLMAVGKRIGSAGGVTFIGAVSSSRYIITAKLNPTTANQWTFDVITSNRLTASANDGVWHDAQVTVNGASSVLAIDGVDTTGSLTGNTTSGNPVFARASLAGNQMQTAEGCAWDNVAADGTQRDALHDNIRAYYDPW